MKTIDSIGAVTGVVSMVGGLAGFVLPVLFGVLLDATGIRSSAFMVLYAWVWLSLIWMYWAEMRRTGNTFAEVSEGSSPLGGWWLREGSVFQTGGVFLWGMFR